MVSKLENTILVINPKKLTFTEMMLKCFLKRFSLLIDRKINPSYLKSFKQNKTINMKKTNQIISYWLNLNSACLRIYFKMFCQIKRRKRYKKFLTILNQKKLKISLLSCWNMRIDFNLKLYTQLQLNFFGDTQKY